VFEGAGNVFSTTSLFPVEENITNQYGKAEFNGWYLSSLNDEDYYSNENSNAYKLNAKSLITTWGSFNQCETGGLHDYSNRQWSGLIGDFYKPRWERWINNRKKELKNESFEEKIDWFYWEWSWVRQDTEYDCTPKELDLIAISKEIL